MQKSTLIVLTLSLVSSFLIASPRTGSGPIPASGLPGPEPLGAGVELIQDGSFEAGTPNPFWNEASTNFGTPICDVPTCGMGGGTGPNTGAVWTWLGGIAALETGSVDQDVTIPNGTATLSFALEVPIACDSAADFVEVRIDGTAVFRVDGTSPECAGAVGYSPRSIDVSNFADGGTHNVGFFSTINGTNGAGSNFFIDDVSLLSVEGGPELPPPPVVPTLGVFGLIALGLLLLLGTMLVRRRST